MPTFLKHRQGSDLTTGFMFTCPTDLVALPGFRKGDFFFLLWDQNWCDFFLNTVDTFFIFFHIFLCSSVVVFAPMVGQFFFCGDVFEKVFFCTFWMIQTPCVFCFKKNTSGEMPVTLSAAESAPFPTDLICVYQVAWGELSANKAMKPSQQKSKMDDDWCMMYIYIYICTPSWELRKSQKKWLLINEFPFSKMGYVSSLDGMFIYCI